MLAASLTTASVPPADTCSAAGSLPYTLTNKTRLSPDSWLLRFALPRRYLGDDPSLPTCLKVLHPEGTDEAGRPKRLEKSYSPVSHPATEGSVDLVVKAYEPRPGGGVGTWLCGLEEGAVMHAALKAKRVMHGDAAVVGRWQHVGLVGGGTGIAPLLQIARILLEDTGSAPAASVRLLSVNRREEDILARQVRRPPLGALLHRYLPREAGETPSRTHSAAAASGLAPLQHRWLAERIRSPDTALFTLPTLDARAEVSGHSEALRDAVR